MTKISIYKEHREEIFEMKKNGTPDTEIVVYLNNTYKSNATLNSLRVFFTRDAVEQKEKQQENSAKETPKVEVEKIIPEIKNDIDNEVKARLVIKELNFLKEKYQEGVDICSILNKELGAATEELRNRAQQKSPYFLLVGIWLLTTLCALFAGYYLGRGFPRIAFLYAMHSLGIPGGVFIGLAIGLAIMYAKLKKERESE